MGRKDGRLARWGPAVFFAAAFIALWVFLERTQPYLFHYREQQQIFLLDGRYVLGLLKRPGGFSLALSQALVQFFPLPLVGSAVTALLGILAGAALWGVCRRIREIPWLLPLCLVPSLLILTALTDTFLSYQALVAFVLAVGLVWLYAAWLSSRRIGVRLGAGAILTLLSFVLCGPFAMTVVAPGIFLSDLFARREKALWQGVQPLLAFGTGLAGIAGGIWKDPTDAFFCDSFYEAWLEVPSSINLCWIALLACLLVFFLCSFIRRIPLPAGIGLALLLTVLAVFFYREGVRKTLDPRAYASKRMYCFVSDGDWDAVLRDPAARYNNLLLTNMVNLALSQKGTLLEDLFAYPQNGPFPAADHQPDPLPFRERGLCAESGLRRLRGAALRQSDDAPPPGQDQSGHRGVRRGRKVYRPPGENLALCGLGDGDADIPVERRRGGKRPRTRGQAEGPPP